MQEEKKEETEMLINPKAEDMCRFEQKHFYKCKECPRTLDDQIFCKLNQHNIQLSKQNRTLEVMNNHLCDIIELLKQK